MPDKKQGVSGPLRGSALSTNVSSFLLFSPTSTMMAYGKGHTFDQLESAVLAMSLPKLLAQPKPLCFEGGGKQNL